MSTYDFEPDPDDYGPEPPHIANPSRIGRAMQVTTDNSATLIAALAEIERLKAEYDLLALNIKQDIERKDAALRVAAYNEAIEDAVKLTQELTGWIGVRDAANEIRKLKEQTP